MTNTAPTTIEAILETFATAQSALPRNALRRARECWPEISPRLLIMLENAASGVRPTDRDRGILFFGVYLMAERRETRALRPLCTLAADKERITAALGKDIVKDLDAIFVRICDSDPAPLQALIENADADEEMRDAALGALTVLTVTGRFDRDEFGRYLAKLHATMLPRGISVVWMTFQQAVALLGYDELVPLVEDVFARGWIDETIVFLEEFQEDFRTVKAADDPLEAYPVPPADPHRLDDITAYLSRWPRFRPKPDLPTFPSVAELVRAKTVHNPHRNVGRNDPCPCGSGKKFKKCCLGKVE